MRYISGYMSCIAETDEVYIFVNVGLKDVVYYSKVNVVLKSEVNIILTGEVRVYYFRCCHKEYYCKCCPEGWGILLYMLS